MKKDTVIGIVAVVIVAGYSALGFYVQKWSSQNRNTNNYKEVVYTESQVTVSETVCETVSASMVSSSFTDVSQATTVPSDVSVTTVSDVTTVSLSDTTTAAGEVTSEEVTTVTPETTQTEQITEAPVNNEEHHEENQEQPSPQPQPEPEPEPEPQPEPEQQSQDFEAPASASDFQRELFRLVNERREQVGVSPLQCTEQFNLAADRRASELPNKFDHVRPDEREWYTIFSDFGIPAGYMGENIAAGSSDAAGVFNQWCNSPDHYANIVNPRYTYIGIGYFYTDSGYHHYWVQLFG